jgi:hypothetical protein
MQRSNIASETLIRTLLIGFISFMARDDIPEHDPEKWVPVFACDKREAFARRSCSNKELERDDDLKKSHRAPGWLAKGVTNDHVRVAADYGFA